MKLKQYKDQIKVYVSTALSFIPIYNVGKYFYSVHKMRVAYATNQEELARLNSVIDSLPTTQADYTEFSKSADPNVVKLYNANLAQGSESKEVSGEFLSKYGCDNIDQFFDKMDALHATGGAEAKEAFNQAMTDYQNEAFKQAAASTADQYVEMFSNFDVGSMDMSFMDSLMCMDMQQSVMAITSGLFALFFISYAYDHTALGKKRAALKKAKKEAKKIKRQEEKKLAKVEAKKYKTSSSQTKEDVKDKWKKPREEEFITISEHDEDNGKKNSGKGTDTNVAAARTTEEKSKDDDLIIF